MTDDNAVLYPEHGPKIHEIHKMVSEVRGNVFAATGKDNNR